MNNQMNEPHGISIHDTHIDRETNKKKKKRWKKNKSRDRDREK